MKFFIALFAICASLSIHGMNDDKKIGGGVSGASKKEQFAKLTFFGFPAGSNPDFWLKDIGSGQKNSEKKNETSSCEPSNKPYRGHMNF